MSFIKDVWTIYSERAKARKALRLLAKQEWSVEFLIYILAKAREIARKDMHIVLRNGNQECIIYADAPKVQNTLEQKEKELDLMDDNMKLQALLDAAEIQGVL